MSSKTGVMAERVSVPQYVRSPTKEPSFIVDDDADEATLLPHPLGNTPMDATAARKYNVRPPRGRVMSIRKRDSCGYVRTPNAAPPSMPESWASHIRFGNDEERNTILDSSKLSNPECKAKNETAPESSA